MRMATERRSAELIYPSLLPLITISQSRLFAMQVCALTASRLRFSQIVMFTGSKREFAIFPLLSIYSNGNSRSATVLCHALRAQEPVHQVNAFTVNLPGPNRNARELILRRTQQDQVHLCRSCRIPTALHLPNSGLHPAEYIQDSMDSRKVLYSNLRARPISTSIS
jgi:hypothetical protein